MRGLCDATINNLLQRVDSLSIRVQSVHKMHRELSNFERSAYLAGRVSQNCRGKMQLNVKLARVVLRVWDL